jgi:CRISPR/Cas system CSM-associated protein Csm5 (group 7 of RAMP superfamily)
MALGASQVGVVPVEGPGFDDENRRRSTFENSLEKRFSSRTLPAQGGAVSPSPNIPIEATRVLEDAKIEAQVQARMDKLIANITVPVDVQPGGEIEENDTRRVHNQTESVFASLPSQQYCLFSQ